MILQGDCTEKLREIPEKSVHTCVTSPPYFGLRDYGVHGQIGLEETPEAYVSRLVEVFREVRRVLRDDGTAWLNLGDSYATGTKAERQQSKNPGVGANRPEAQNSVRRIGTPDGLKTKDLIGIPWRVAFALQADGWYLRSDIIWSKPNPMPESVRDRPTKAHEYIFLLSKCDRYYYDHEAIKEPFATPPEDRNNEGWGPSRKDHHLQSQSAVREGKGRMGFTGDGRNKRTVWTVTTKPFKGAHFATFPPDLIKPCVFAGSPEGGTVLDPFFGAGTTGLVALQNNRKFIGIELNPSYIEIANARLQAAAGLFPFESAPEELEAIE